MKRDRASFITELAERGRVEGREIRARGRRVKS
jgi:hypothetical protein